MTPYYQDDWLTVHLGDCREVMAAMEPESVNCVVTSPPYWGLRDYGTATWIGGDEACDHLERSGGTGKSTLGTASGGHGISPEGQVRSTERSFVPAKGTCRKCGAQRIDAQLGLEPTPEAYVANLVAVFREVRRVLRSDGTVWLNLGDSFAGGGYSNHANTGGAQREDGGKQKHTTSSRIGLKPKDLVGIPWRVAFALQADGWYLRSDIIWAKPNPMPESVTDRPTKSHEYLFLLSKSPRYYFDADAVREANEHPNRSGTNPRLAVSTQPGNTFQGRDGRAIDSNPAGRNIRSVWTVATQPYPGAHFATFPQKLVEPCIKAGTSERGVCPECGAPWERVVVKGPPPPEPMHRDPAKRLEPGQAGNVGAGNMGFRASRLSGQEMGEWKAAHPDETTGWQPSCRHDALPVPATCLDPFAGSGTTGLVAQRLSRRAVLIDLSGDYLEQVMDRNRDIPLGLGA